MFAGAGVPGSFSSLFPFNEKTPGSVRRKTEGGIIVEADVKYETPLAAQESKAEPGSAHIKITFPPLHGFPLPPPRKKM